MSLLLVAVWALCCTLAGATPQAWHRPIAYTLMVLSLPVFALLWQAHGGWAVAGFLALGLFQFRLLIRHYLRRAVRALGGNARPRP
ncbi:MAG: DUF2484 family protein [Pseudomonadota bacterium]